MDTGIDANHPDLEDNVEVEISADFTGEMTIFGCDDDPNGHGTHVAGIVGAVGNNSVGVAGTCWTVSLASLRVFDENGRGYSSYVARAIEYAEAMNIPILNLSGSWKYNSEKYDVVLESIIENYSGLLVTSAGNEGICNNVIPSYPNCYNLSNLVSVGASNSEDSLMEYYEDDVYQGGSNYGSTTVDLFAPGDEIYSTLPNGRYGRLSGTSMASPYVAGVAALLLSINPNLTASELKSIIMTSCDEVSEFADKCVSGGRLNAYRAVSSTITYSVMVANSSINLSISSGGYKWIKFTASTEGAYMFYTEYTEDEIDTMGELFSELVADNSTSGRLLFHDDISSSDDGDPDYNFYFAKYLAAGEIVYLRVSAYDDGSCILKIVKR